MPRRGCAADRVTLAGRKREAVRPVLVSISGALDVRPARHDGAVASETDPVRERYLALVDDLVGIDGVTPPPGGSGFGRGSLRYRGKIFAMLVRGALVVKLPGARVAELITAGEGAAFDANKGKPMREWLSVDPGSRLDWLGLATEALDFARAGAATPKRGRR